MEKTFKVGDRVRVVTSPRGLRGRIWSIDRELQLYEVEREDGGPIVYLEDDPVYPDAPQVWYAGYSEAFFAYELEPLD